MSTPTHITPGRTTTSREAREQARSRKARRALLISSVSTVAVIGGLIVILITSPGWSAVKETFFSWSAFKSSFPSVLRGFWLDVRMFMVIEVVVLAAGLLIALCRTIRLAALFPLRLLSVVFVDVMRGVPTILIVYLIGFGIPALGLAGLPTSEIVLGSLALALCYSAYVSEVYRAGIESIHPSQSAAALALGLTARQSLRHVVLPQAVRRVAPPLLNDFISLQKDVALVSILGPVEAFRAAQIYGASTFNYTPMLAAAALYLCVTIPLTRIVDRMQSRARTQRGAAIALGPR